MIIKLWAYSSLWSIKSQNGHIYRKMILRGSRYNALIAFRFLCNGDISQLLFPHIDFKRIDSVPNTKI